MIEEGKPICLVSSENKVHFHIYNKNKQFVTHKGVIDFKSISDYGDIVYSSKGEPYFVLRPTFYDKMMEIKRKTTIIYPKDAGYLILNSSFNPSGVNLEVGSGSGAFTILLASLLSESGRLYTFERRDEFINLTRENLEKLELLQKVEIIKRDVAKDGFGVEEADSVFIDVPEPWTIIPHAYNSLKHGAYLTSISPNIEQVQKTVFKMEEIGFKRIKTVEIFEREILVRRDKTRPRELSHSHTVYITFGAKIKNKR